MPIDVPAVNSEGPDDELDFVGILRDCLACAVITLDDQQQIITFNAKAEELTSLNAGKILGKGLKVLPVALGQIISETFASGQPAVERRISLPDPKRGNIVVQVNVTPTLTSHAKTTGAVVVMNDISPIRKWESNMRRLDRLHSIGTLSASMAHEIRNAFVAVRTFVDLLLEKNKEADLAEIVRMEMNRIDSIVGQMMKFSGPPKPNLSAVHVHSVLNKSLLLVQHLLDDKKIELIRSFNAAQDVIAGDQDQLEQALLNLFFNALDAMNANGQLEVSTESLPPDTRIEGLPAGKPEYLLRVVVRDSGAGIAPENLRRLFEPFFTTKSEGTGLGLPITRRIIQEHQGVISVVSEPGKGTAFSFVLPGIKP